MKHITPRKLHELLTTQRDLFLIDVRSMEEYNHGHISQAKHLPLELILSHPHQAIEEINTLRDNQDPVYVVCLSDRRSFMACCKLSEYNLTNVCFIQGGTQAWVAEGYPISEKTNP